MNPLRDLVTLDVVVDPLYDQNCYVLRRRDTDAVLVVDPGLQHPAVLELLERSGLRVERILATHGHGDHVNGVPAVRAAHGCSAFIHPADRELLPYVSRLPGIPADTPPVEFDQDLTTDVDMEWQGLHIRALHTPGHTRGSVCILVQLDGPVPDLIAGDTLFRRGVGRTDLPGGSWDELLFSIENTLYRLPSETVVRPGHGPSTSIGEESSENPFVVHPRYR